MISVVPEEDEEDINMESYGEEGYEHEHNGEYADTEGEETPPQNTPQPMRATRPEKREITDTIRIPPISPVRRSDGGSGASRAISGEGTRPLGG